MLQSLRSRLFAAFLLPTALFVSAAGWLGYRAVRDLLEDELGRSLSSVAAATAAQVSAERLLSLEPGDEAGEGTRTYRNLHRQLTEIAKAAGVRRIVAFDASGAVRVDAGGGLPIGTAVPELSRDRLELTQVLHGGSPAWSSIPFEGSDGRWYLTGYAPVLAQNGAAVAVIGVEGSAAFFGPLARLFRLYALWVAGGIGLLALLALWMGRTLAEPLRRLLDSAVRIGRGDLTTSVPAQPTSEIGGLAKELEAMRQALLSRDQQLKMMLAGVAHEVRNPLGGVELFAGLLEEELTQGLQKAPPAPASAESVDHVRKIRREVDYLRRIVEDFLAFAREARLSPARLDAQAWIQETCERIASEAQERGVRVTVEARPGQLEVDESLVGAALMNLLKNALQASERGQAIAVTGQILGDFYVIEVADQGKGMSAEVSARIFEPFFTTREQGTGLGLPLARKIARAHGGELALAPSEQGARFALSLPLLSPASEASPA